MFTKFEFFSFKPKFKSFAHEELVIVEQIVKLTGSPIDSGVKVSRKDLLLAESFHVHIDVGGEGLNEHMGCISGFTNSINLNAMTKQSNPYGIPIPNLVRLESWSGDPDYLFADGFADYITMQNAPLTEKNVTEIARCLRPGGLVELWIDDSFLPEMKRLASLLKSEIELDSVDQFKGTTGSQKFRIVSGIKSTLEAVIVLSVPTVQSRSYSELVEVMELRLYLEINFFSKLKQKTITYEDPKLIKYEPSL